ncbi:MAG: hypothetical protein DMF04_06340 [Verrucomicrobia bacterium]|nr:MAG: hypothetical protein DMF04_06340 [Verrucomicrobiota bacterium]
MPASSRSRSFTVTDVCSTRQTGNNKHDRLGAVPHWELASKSRREREDIVPSDHSAHQHPQEIASPIYNE